jgi:hypothetical protein
MSFGQTFNYGGYIYSANGGGASGVEVKLYERTTSAITGFTSQTNWNGHSYYRSTASSTWTNAKAECENMGGHLVTMSTAAENSFVFNTWPSGWIGLYQDKSGAFYSEPNGGWRWTENYVTDKQVSKFETFGGLVSGKLRDNVGSKDATLYNGPSYVSSGGQYLQFDGSNDYAITGNLASYFPNASEVQTLQLLCYPSDPGVLVSELGVGNASSGWHESVMEITANGTLRVGFWNGSGISSIGTSISMNTWNMITMTYDGSTLRGYLNGILFGTVTFNREVPHAYSGNGLYYCFGKDDATNMGNGTYANFRLGTFDVYNKVLSADEVMRNWTSISYRYGRMPYTNWNGGEPNNSGGEDYIQFVSSGRWNDLPNVSLPYVIEFDYVVTNTSWTLLSTSKTGSDGRYSFSVSTNPSKEYYIQFDVPTLPKTILSFTDADAIVPFISKEKTPNGLDYKIFDLNNNGRINVADMWYLFGRKSGRFTSWTSPIYDVRYYTVSDFNSIKSYSYNVNSSFQGQSQITINTPTNNGSTNFYLISPGYSGNVSY